MSLIVEDGSTVEGANTYVSATDAFDYATARGVSLPSCDDALEAVILKAMDYLESFSAKFKGERVTRDQPVSWPRSGAVIEGWPWDDDEIPRQVLTAQLALIIEINSGEDPYNPSTVLPVIREKVDVIEVQYASPTSSKVSKTQASRTLINLLLKNSGLFAVRT